MANGLAGWTGTWKEHDWNHLGKKHVHRSLQMGKGVKTLVSHVPAHQKVTSAGEKFTNQVGR